MWSQNVKKTLWQICRGVYRSCNYRSKTVFLRNFPISTLSRRSKNHLYDEAQNSDFYLCIHKIQDLLVRIAKVRACFFCYKIVSQITKKKFWSFFYSGHVIKNMPNKKENKKNKFFIFSWGQNVYHYVWYHYFWYQMKGKLICDKAKKIQIKIIIQSKNIPLFVKGMKSGKFHKPQ